jgi:hypothetical protein
MSGDYIVVSPIPQNMVLRYEKRMAMVWTTRRVAPPPAPPAAAPAVNVAQRMAPVPAPQTQSPPPAQQSGTVRLANMTALYSDKVTDSRQ